MPGPSFKSLVLANNIVVLAFDLSGTEITPEELRAWALQLLRPRRQRGQPRDADAGADETLYMRFCANMGLNPNRETRRLYDDLAKIQLAETPRMKKRVCRTRPAAHLGITTLAGFFAHSYEELGNADPKVGSLLFQIRAMAIKLWLWREHKIRLVQLPDWEQHTAEG